MSENILQRFYRKEADYEQPIPALDLDRIAQETDKMQKARIKDALQDLQYVIDDLNNSLWTHWEVETDPNILIDKLTTVSELLYSMLSE